MDAVHSAVCCHNVVHSTAHIVVHNAVPSVHNPLLCKYIHKCSDCFWHCLAHITACHGCVSYTCTASALVVHLSIISALVVHLSIISMVGNGN